MRLSELKSGESATILKVTGHGGFRRRIVEMGFIRGKRVEVILNAPLKDPIEYRIMGYDVSLRRSEASMVIVLSDEEAEELLAIQQEAERNTPFTEEAEERVETIDDVVTRSSHTISVALIGNPNSGKTSLFNAISGGHEHVGNYSGVTVSAKRGVCHYRGYRFEVTDLPGTYALSAYTPEERFVRSHIADEQPDVIINSVVASNLERNLFLTTELIDINPRMVVALNMYDELEASGAHLDYDSLGRMLGVPMVPVEARNHKGIDELLDTVIAVYEGRDERVRHIHISHGSIIENGLQQLGEAMNDYREELPKQFPPRYYALKLLESDRDIEERLQDSPRYAEWCALRDRVVKHIQGDIDEDIETALANQKYGFISGALKETFTPGKRDERAATNLIDMIVTHRVWGFPIFFLVMGLMFWCTFSLGAYPQEWIDLLVGWIGAGVNHLMPEGVLRDLVVDGMIGGVGSVIVFLPNIMILYLFISFMEDSGYLARAAFIMDRVMHRAGLHGKSFIPLIMGFGCNVPAIMACRTIESRSSRLITILITPFMACSARLPVFILLTAAFFPTHGGLVMAGLYLLGVLMAILTARLMRLIFFPVDETPFVMELPPYRIPTWKATLTHMWDKCAQYLKKMGGMILVASIVIWFLSYYPRPDVEQSAMENRYENSYLGRLGKACSPVFEPLGLDWKAGVSLLSGVAAKEIIVSTIGVLYAEEDTESGALTQKIAASGDFTPASALAFLVFILLYFPCIATIAAIGAEAGWRWAIGGMIYNTLVAWGIAWIFYQIGILLM